MDRRLELIDRLVEVFNGANLEAFAQLLDEDVEIYSTPALANEGTFRGRDAYLAWAAAWMEAWSSFTVTFESDLELIDETEAVGAMRQHAVGRGSAIGVDLLVAYRLTIRDGKVVRFQIFADLDTARRAARSGWSALSGEPEP